MVGPASGGPVSSPGDRAANEPDRRDARLPFLDDAFLRPYFETIAPRVREPITRIDVGGGGGRTAFAIRRSGPFEILELPGSGVADYMDIGRAGPEETISVLDAALSQSDADLLILRNVRGDSPTIPAAMQLAEERKWLSVVETVDQAPYVDLDGDWQSFYERRRDRKSRYTLRRSARLLSELGELEFAHHTAPDDVKSHLDEAFDLYAERERKRDAPWRFGGAVGRRFYAEVALGMARQNALDLAFLRVGGSPVAFAYSLVYDDVYYYYVVGITNRPEVQQFSPGGLLLEHLLEASFRRGLRRFDFMLGGETYKTMWETGRETVYTLVLARRRPKSVAAWLLYRSRGWVRDWIRRSPSRSRVSRLGINTLLRLRHAGRTRSGKTGG